MNTSIISYVEIKISPDIMLMNNVFGSKLIVSEINTLVNGRKT